MPEECCGVNGHAVYIDTEGSFNASRLQGFSLIFLYSIHYCINSLLDMGEACIEHCRRNMNLGRNTWSLGSIIDNIFVFRCKEVTELLSCVMVLKEFLRTHPQV